MESVLHKCVVFLAIETVHPQPSIINYDPHQLIFCQTIPTPFTQYYVHKHSNVIRYDLGVVMKDQCENLRPAAQNVQIVQNRSPHLPAITRIKITRQFCKNICVSFASTKLGHTIQYLLKKSRLTPQLVLKIMYFCFSLLIKLHISQFYLLCPLEFCLIIENENLQPQIIFTDKFSNLKDRIASLNNLDAKKYAEFYPIQEILSAQQNRKQMQSIDTSIIVRSLVRLINRCKNPRLQQYLEVIDWMVVPNSWKHIEEEQVLSQLSQDIQQDLRNWS